ncbi:MAG: cobalt ECF transporter T component CbiQ [Armatimonadota bacterium]
MRRAVGSLARLLSDMLQDETTAARRGVLQGIDARFKVVGMIGLIVVATLIHRLSGLALCYALCVTLAAGSRVSFRRFAGVWLVVPLFSAAIMLPATLNIVTPGSPILTIWHFTGSHFGPWHVPKTLAITDVGLFIAARFILRTGVCVTLAVLLTSTTSHARLFHGLRAMGVPQMFIVLLGMMERYLGTLVRAAEEIHLAKISRSVAIGTLRQEQAWVAAGIGSLFRRTYRLSDNIYMAMLSRGYTGEVRLLDPPRLRFRDWAFLLATVGVGAGLLLI